MSSYKVLTLSGSDPACETYLPLVYSSFLKQLRYGNEWFALIDQGIYFGMYHKVIESLLSRPTSTVRLAVLSDDLDTCLGWSLSDGQTLHFVFVKLDQRHQGIGKSLLPITFKSISHLTSTGKSIWQKKFPDVLFNPFLT